MSTSGIGRSVPKTSYICMFCMNSTKSTEYPKTCSWCEVFFCEVCFSRLKGASLVCAGCAKVLPTGYARFYPATSLSAASGLVSWLKQGSTSGITYDIVKNMDDPDETVGWRIVKILAHGEQVDSESVRDLDETEVKALVARIHELQKGKGKNGKTDGY